MSIEVDAIYDGGILKPLTPLALPDQSPVRLTVEPKSIETESEALATQQKALRELWELIDKLPKVKNDDGWSVRQMDELLYGKP
jgi:predicted DNA-binding antitoxin AbrB/MazE fold protein